MDPFNERYNRLVGPRKRKLFGDLSGPVLEIGAGTGSNLKYLPKDAVWYGIEAEFSLGRAEDLPARDSSMDAVVATLVLCSVKDPRQALREILRVLKPGGRFVFIEHVAAAEGTSTRRRQNWISPMWRLLADGCHPNRETWRFIDQAGFAGVDYERFRVNLPVAGPHIAGLATKSL